MTRANPRVAPRLLTKAEDMEDLTDQICFARVVRQRDEGRRREAELLRIVLELRAALDVYTTQGHHIASDARLDALKEGT